MKTIKLTLEGEPAYVEAINRLLGECLDIAEASKDQHVALRPGIVRRVLRIYAEQGRHRCHSPVLSPDDALGEGPEGYD